MRNLLFTLLGFLLFCTAMAQDCKSNLYMTNNAKLQMTIYDKKGKITGVQNITINDVKKAGTGYQSTVTTAMVDEKGKAMSNASGTYKCVNGILSADIKMFMPQEQMSKMGEAEAGVEPVYIEYPAAPSEGQTLSKAEMTMNVKMNSGIAATVTFKEENRKIGAKETITSPAGSWQAYVITYDGNMKIKMGGLGLPAFNFSVKEWYVPGMGIVKSESYSKGGKLSGSTLLTSVTK